MDTLEKKNLKDFLRDELGKIFKFLLLLYLLVAAIFLVKEFFGGQETVVREEERAEEESPAEQKEFFINKPDSIFIEKLGIEAPVTFVESTDPKDFVDPLDRGVVLYPSALPGEEGRTIILGHSAPPGWPKIKYDWVFSDLEELETGDRIFLYFEHLRYQYIVREKIFLEAGEDTDSIGGGSAQSELFLISCWPPGIDHKRIVVRSDLAG